MQQHPACCFEYVWTLNVWTLESGCVKIHIVLQLVAREFRQVQVFLPTRSDQAVETLGQQRTAEHSCYSHYQALLVPIGAGTIPVRAQWP